MQHFKITFNASSKSLQRTRDVQFSSPFVPSEFASKFQPIQPTLSTQQSISASFSCQGPMFTAGRGSVALRTVAHRLHATFIYEKNNRVWCNLLTAGRQTGEMKADCSFLEGHGASSSRGSEWLSGGMRWSQQRAAGLQLNQRHC